MSEHKCRSCNGPTSPGTAYCSPGCRYHVSRYLGVDYMQQAEAEAREAHERGDTNDE